MKINKKALLVFLGAVALGTGVFLNLNQILTLIQERTSPLINMIQPTITQAQNVLGQIPEAWRNFLLVSGPAAALSLGVAWWKNRQMNELAKASMAKIQDLSTINMNAQQLQNTSQAKIQELESQVQTYSQQNLSGMVQSLQNQLADQKTTYENQIQKQINDFNAMERTLQNTITQLKQQQVTVVR